LVGAITSHVDLPTPHRPRSSVTAQQVAQQPIKSASASRPLPIGVKQYNVRNASTSLLSQQNSLLLFYPIFNLTIDFLPHIDFVESSPN
jgi:hypothetical protein